MQNRTLKSLVELSIKPHPWDYLNELLYRLCRENPFHTNREVVLAKIILIGRTYSAALERRRKDPDEEGDFYIDHAVPRILHSDIDDRFLKLSGIETLSLADLNQVLDVHGKLTHLFFEISGQRKRSLASKYLHFHFPELFFIFDSVARQTVQRKWRNSEFPEVFSSTQDDEYSTFVYRCLDLREYITTGTGTTLNPRQFDNFLFLLAAEPGITLI